jgi:hypothetical protein
MTNEPPVKSAEIKTASTKFFFIDFLLDSYMFAVLKEQAALLAAKTRYSL